MEDKNYCPTCKNKNRCPWRDISNDNCAGLFYEKGRALPRSSRDARFSMPIED